MTARARSAGRRGRPPRWRAGAARATRGGVKAAAALLCAALLLDAAAARAEEPSQSIALRLGAYVPTGPAMAGLEPGPEGELTLGVRLLPHLSAELGAGLVRPGRSAAAARDPLTGATRVVAPDLWDVPVGGGLRGAWRTGRLELSATAGVAVHFVRVRREVVQAGQVTASSDQDAVLGARLGAAAALVLGRGLTAGIEARLDTARPFLFGARERVDGLRLGLRVAQGF